MKLTSF